MSNANGHKNGKGRRWRNYSDAEKAAALVVLDYCKGNTREAARRLDIPEATIRAWANGRINEDCAELHAEKKADLAEVLEQLALNLVQKLLKAKDASSVDLGIVVDKLLLVRGEPNAISKDVTHAAPEQRRARILQLVQKAKVESA